MGNIWKKKATVKDLDLFSKGTLVNHLDIQFKEIGDDFVSATMPVDHRTIQPMGLLHGGASVALAETLGSIASYLTLEDSFYSVGLEINANHLKSARSGKVTGTARPIHLGRTTQVWDILIESEKQEKICISRLTMAILRNEKE